MYLDGVTRFHKKSEYQRHMGSAPIQRNWHTFAGHVTVYVGRITWDLRCYSVCNEITVGLPNNVFMQAFTWLAKSGQFRINMNDNGSSLKGVLKEVITRVCQVPQAK